MAIAELTTLTPACSSMRRASMRKMTCSSEPVGMARTNTTSHSSSGTPPAVSRGRRLTLAVSCVTG